MSDDTVGARLPLYALVAANTVSMLGNTIAAVAIPWFVLVTTGSAAKRGLAAGLALDQLGLRATLVALAVALAALALVTALSPGARAMARRAASEHA